MGWRELDTVKCSGVLKRQHQQTTTTTTTKKKTKAQFESDSVFDGLTTCGSDNGDFLQGRRNGLIKLKAVRSWHHGDGLGTLRFMCILNVNGMSPCSISGLWRTPHKRCATYALKGTGVRMRGDTDCDSPSEAFYFCFNSKTHSLGRDRQVSSSRQKMRSLFSNPHIQHFHLQSQRGVPSVTVLGKAE